MAGLTSTLESLLNETGFSLSVFWGYDGELRARNQPLPILHARIA